MNVLLISGWKLFCGCIIFTDGVKRLADLLNVTLNSFAKLYNNCKNSFNIYNNK